MPTNYIFVNNLDEVSVLVGWDRREDREGQRTITCLLYDESQLQEALHDIYTEWPSTKRVTRHTIKALSTRSEQYLSDEQS